MEEALLHLKSIQFQVGGHSVIHEIDVPFPKGQTTGIMGASGSGKSTLLKIAAGLLLPTDGQVLYEGQDIGRFSEPEMVSWRCKTGFVFQTSALWANKTAYQNIELPLNFHFPKMTKAQVKERIDELCRILGFDDDLNQRPAQLSAGEQKIVSLARALATDPECLFLDDPTASLDAQSLSKFTELIKTLKEKKKTMIMVNLGPDLTAKFCDHLVLLKQGKVLLQGPFGEVVRSEDPEVKKILTDVLSQTATFSGDILNLLSDDPTGGFF